MIDLKKLVENGVQFGHQTWRWAPRMARYIWGTKNGVHLIDVSKTAVQLEKACQFLEEVAADGKQILWVGTKKAAQGIIKDTAVRLGSPYASNRWVGGTLSNFSQVKKSVTKLLHHEDILAKAEKYSYTKKELSGFQKVVNRLEENIGGVRSLNWPVGAVVVVDAKKEATAIKEALAMNVPVIALVDTNSDPSGIFIVIPGNDDVSRSIRVIVDELAAAAGRGIEKAKANKVKLAEAAELAAKNNESPSEEVTLPAVEGEEEESTNHRAPRSRKPGESKGTGALVVEDPTKKSAPRRTSSSTRSASGPRRRPASDKPAERKTAEKPAAEKPARAEKKASTEDKAE